MSRLDLRVPPVAVVLLAGAVMWLLASAFPWPGDLLGGLPAALLIAGAGMAIAVAGVVAFRRARTTVNPMKPETSSALVERGIYRFTRNPMYLGMALALAAWAVWLGSVAAAAVLPAFTLYMTRFQIIPEERALAATFGEAFRAYRGRVRRWL
jgi:protein-S-isoprenylcysteine O-methyltransferase Ste14